MKDIKADFSIKELIDEFNIENRNNKEFFHAMQSHFIRNDLQKIIFMLELVKMGNYQNLDEQIERIYQLCIRASKKVDTINRIHRVIHSKFINPKERFSLIDIVEKTAALFDFSVRIDYDSLNFNIEVDAFFKDMLFELFTFIKNFKGDQVGISGVMGDKNPEYFILRISESKNVPFSHDMCEKLLTGLKTEEWDYLGDNIEITFVSMIACYYGGKLTIHSSEEIGNCYSIFIPFALCSPNSIN